MLKVQIIVLNYNGLEILPGCLPSIVEAARRSAYPTTVTVLDNRSTDTSLEWVKENLPEVRRVTAPKNLFLVSFNDYFKQIEEDIVIPMNNDIRVDPGFVDPLVRVFEEHPDAFLASSQCFSFDGTRYEGGRSRAEIRWGLFWSSAIFPGSESRQNEFGYTFAAGFGALQRKHFLALGGYDDLYLPGITEDADLGFRAWREGYRCYYVPQSRIFHLGQASFKKAFGQKKVLTLAHRNGFLFLWKNLSDPSLLLEHGILLGPRLIFALLRGQPELFLGFCQALTRGWEALRHRKFLPKRSRSDREIFELSGERPRHRRYRFKRRWKRVLAGIFDFAGSILFAASKKQNRQAADPKKILVFRLDSLGDGVLTLPALQKLIQRFPNAQLDFMLSRSVQDLYAVCFPSAKLHLFQGWNGDTLKQLRKERYDLGIDFRGDVRAILMMTLAGIPDRWARGGTGGSFLLTRDIRNPYQKHEILENLELIQGNGINQITEPVEFPPLPSSSAIRSFPGKKIVIHVGAGYPSKRWPAERFVEVARRIQDKNLGLPVFIGSHEEKELLSPYLNRLRPNLEDLTGKTSLNELLGLFREADLFIGNDSGPAHLAAWAGCRLLTVFSGTNDFRQWAPWSSKLRILQHSVPCSPCEERVCPLKRQLCLDEITAEEVFRAAEEMLTV